MREIKFRAINASNKIIYGLPYTDGVNETIYYNDFNNRLCWRDVNGSHCNQPYKNGTLMQFTGLHDKNGKEIYEGDIIRGNLYNHEVRYERAYFGLTKFGLSSDYPMHLLRQEDFEVIGNIYENPKLLTNNI